MLLSLLAASTYCKVKAECHPFDPTCSPLMALVEFDVCRLPYWQVTDPLYAGEVQRELKRVANRGSIGAPSTSQFGSGLPAVNDWSGGVLVPGGKIYGIPATETRVLVIDTNQNTLNPNAITGLAAGAYKWIGGVLAPNGKIYGIPAANLGQGFLIIDPATDTATTTGNIDGYNGGVLAPNGKIYAIPSDLAGKQFAVLDPETNSVQTFGPSFTTRFVGGVLGLNGKIYAIPGFGDGQPVAVVDPTSNTVTNIGAGVASEGWFSAALAPDGKIYGNNLGANAQLQIDPYASTVNRIGPTGAANDFEGSVLASNGKIYGTTRSAAQFTELDPATLVQTRFGASGGPYSGGILAPNGKIYGIPRQATTGIIIDPASRENLCPAILMSGYLNKL
ncbi:MAG: hypothetical protein K8S54_08100 [Spirochaetia bacterium]|nr:hypothetical protein [Spirochaetia bacterium]